MQEPIFFENEIVQPKNLNFLNDSMAKNIKDIVTLLTDSRPGIASGMSLTGISGNNFFTVSAGFGFTGDGERIELYSGNNINIDFTGTQSIYAQLNEVVYNPDPSENPAGSSNVITNIDPTDSSLVAVENYNVASVSAISGIGFINLGTVTADSSMKFVSASTSGADFLTIANIININDNTINGLNIASGSVDSNIFTNPLTFDITLGTDVDITFANSGNNNIGSVSNPLANVYAVTGNFHELSGMSPILTDTFWQKTGTSLEATGNNTVQVDRNQQGTQFGRGIILNTESISTVGNDKNINITTDPLKSINLDATVNVTSGHNLYVKDNLFVSGDAFFTNTNLSSVTGNFTVNGEISYTNTSQQFDNLIRNSNFATPSGNITGTATPPANWSIFVPNQDFAYGPLTNGAEYLNTPVALNNVMNLLGHTGNYTVEANVKKFGNSLFGDGFNQIWAKFNPILSSGISFSVRTNGAVEMGSVGGTLVSPASINNNQWYHIAYTWDGSQRRLWVDGVQVANDGLNGAFGTTNEQRLASFGTNNRSFNGLVNNFAFSNVARSSFPSGSAGSAIDSNTLSYWKFERNLLDSSPNARTLVQVGVATGTFSNTQLGQYFSGTIAGTGTDSTLSPSTENVYLGEPHVSSWLLGSGVNIDPTGISIVQALPDLKVNTPYNLSFYSKGFTNFSGLAIDAFISGTSPSGTPVVSTLTAVPNLMTSNTWDRQSYGFTSAATGTDFSLNLRLSAPTGSSTTGVIGLTAVQMTEGLATVPYSSRDRVQQITIQMPSTFQVTTTAGTSVTSTITDLSRTFYTKGGFCIINASLSPVVSRVSAANGQDVDFRPFLVLDGAQVSTVINAIPYATANTFPAGGNYEFSGQGHLTYSTYLEPGFHTLLTKMSSFGGGSPNVGQWAFRVHGGSNSTVSITIFE